MEHVVVGSEYCADGEEREITVSKTSVFYPGDGFAGYDHHRNGSGELIFRVDNYSNGGRGLSLVDEMVLMDAAGAPLLTLRKKRLSLHHRWDGFLGERREGQKPLFTVRRSSIFSGDEGEISVELHVQEGLEVEYRIEGSFADRSCKVLMYKEEAEEGEEEGPAVVVAEVKRKVDSSTQMLLGRDVFSLCLKPRFDAAFAMGLVLILDQISGNDDDDDDTIAAPFAED